LIVKDKKNSLSPIYNGSKPNLKDHLNSVPGSIIAEYKPGSPSKGKFEIKYSPEQIGEFYKLGGASCISVLTEKKYFYSSLDNLFRFQGLQLPLLRKDFILHPLQIVQTAATPASAVLLICRYFKGNLNLLKQLTQQAKKLGLEPVLEIFNKRDLELARMAEAEVIQVNNRDLDSLEIDLDQSRKLVQHKKDQELWICASGINNNKIIQEMILLGFQSFLIGSHLMLSRNPVSALQKLKKKDTS
jgi:indole-3-glycerol phosphate synthase